MRGRGVGNARRAELQNQGSYQRLADSEVGNRLDTLPRSVAEVDHSVRFSRSAGFKTSSSARTGEAWSLPLDGAPSTHILKPEPAHFPGLAAAEAWALHASSAVTRTASARLDTPEGHRPTLIVERYDRDVRPGSVVRIHQEDLCQVLGLPPAAKYPLTAKPGEASLHRLADLLVARAAEAPNELTRLLEQTAVNVALGNTDAHAKNVSVIHLHPHTVTLSPL